jgi:ubiquinone biosynthesis protein UbiJ
MGAFGWNVPAQPDAYNSCMFGSLPALAESAVMARATLVVNHVLAAEPAALERLRVRSGSSLRIDFTDWPKALPPLPSFSFLVTPAGLFEWLGPERQGEPDLRIEVDAANPALALMQAIGGTRPRVHIIGDAMFAADIDWLIANLRWDVEDDLARVVGAGPAQQIGRLAGFVAQGFRGAVDTLRGAVGKVVRSPASPEGPATR